MQVWDEELAAVAQRWADQCDRGHDKSRNVGSSITSRLLHEFLNSKIVVQISDRFRVGQNVAMTWSFEQAPPTGDAAEFVRHIGGWFDEVKLFDPRHIAPFKFKKKLGHYTQV